MNQSKQSTPKNTNIDYLGELPKHWKITKLKYIAKYSNGNSISDNEKNNYKNKENARPYIATKDIDLDTSTINYDTELYIPYNNSNFKEFVKGCILVCIEGGSGGRKKGFVTQNISIGNKLCAIKITTKDMNERFMFYIILSNTFNDFYNANIQGDRNGVPLEKIGYFVLPLPPLKEQEKIAKYLDKKISSIDKSLQTTKTLQQNLKNLKNALITQCVTKGLDKNAPLKNTNIDYLGEIPKGWGVTRIKILFDNKKEKNIGLKNKNLLSLSYGKIINKDINSAFGLLPESFETYQIIQKGDIILRLTDLQNDQRSLRVGLATQQGIITSAYITLRQKKKTNDERFFYYFLHAFDIQKDFYRMGQGVRQNLTYDNLKSLKIPLPPLKEQEKIAKYLDKEVQKIDTLYKSLSQLETTLKAFKKALISDCVLGKKEIK
ncbi:restriction endonuclease subunit S [Helicobacter cetorum]|uniref:restriction endonuclease subunit S n=1 Tax=Helicobacter cetorum TaxID=138563 RepID=UPI000CF08290|nr:restriction endonuclease subunit S [Helicobacter cetorum]